MGHELLRDPALEWFNKIHRGALSKKGEKTDQLKLHVATSSLT